MLKNKKNAIIISVIVIIALAVTVTVVSRSFKKGNNSSMKTESSTAETIADNANANSTEKVAEESYDNNTTTKAPEIKTTTASVEKTTAVVTTKPANTKPAAPVTTKAAVTTTKPAAPTTTKPAVVTTAAPVTTTRPQQTSLLQATNIPGTYAAKSFEKAIFDRVNIERTSRGLPALRWNDNLHALAAIRAGEIITKWGHERPNGQMPVSLLNEYNISRTGFGENIIKGSPESEEYVDALVEAWMGSDGHRANILNANFEYCAIASKTDSSGMAYVAQLFYTP